MYPKRFSALNKLLEEKNISALLVSNPHNIHYLTGFRSMYPEHRDSMLLVLPGSAHFILSPLYSHRSPDIEKIVTTHTPTAEQNYYQTVLSILKEKSITKLSFETNNLRVVEFDYLRKLNSQLELAPAQDIVETIRIIKDPSEIQKITSACTRIDKVLYKIQNLLQGKTEKEIAFQIRTQAEKLKANNISFESIVALNANSAIPHHTPSLKTIIKNGIVLIDCGVEYEGYMSDITRMFLLKNKLPASVVSKFKSTYQQLLDVQLECIDKIKIGMTGEEAYNVCFNKLKEYKLDSYFNHALGHGLGLEIHENPRISLHSTEVLQENMVFTIEPGVYFENKFGIRIEDTVLLTKMGCKVLTNFPKDLSSLEIK